VADLEVAAGQPHDVLLARQRRVKRLGTFAGNQLIGRLGDDADSDGCQLRDDAFGAGGRPNHAAAFADQAVGRCAEAPIASDRRHAQHRPKGIAHVADAGAIDRVAAADDIDGGGDLAAELQDARGHLVAVAHQTHGVVDIACAMKWRIDARADPASSCPEHRRLAHEVVFA
jgi:hypothetical protein